MSVGGSFSLFSRELDFLFKSACICRIQPFRDALAMNNIWFTLKRLGLGLILIAVAASVLLFSDMRSRRPIQNSETGPDASKQSHGEKDLTAPSGRSFHIGIAYLAPEQAIDSCLAGLMEGLKELGYEEGKNVKLLKTHAQGEMLNIPAIMQNFDSSDIDVLVTFTTPMLQGACFRIKNKPVVFTCVTDPIAAGAGRSWMEHLEHVTGVGSFPPLDQTMDLIPRLVPGIKSLGTLYNSGEANSVKIISVMRELTRKKGIKLVELTAASSGEVAQTTQGLVARDVQAIYIPSDNTAYQALDGILKVAATAHLPVINDDAEYLSHGMLASVGPGFFQSGKATAPYVARVLLGENPANIPMTNVSINVTALNPDVAKKLGITLSPALLR
ncbi:MAG: hypothetical protein JWM99_722 [Verrucomicrobiales bacterium]|nr:hypothetical protein [Verrucomicrobiales bacterium]